MLVLSQSPAHTCDAACLYGGPVAALQRGLLGFRPLDWQVPLRSRAGVALQAAPHSQAAWPGRTAEFTSWGKPRLALAQVGHFAGNLFPVPAGFVAPDARPRAWPQLPSRRAPREGPRPSEGDCVLCAREAQPHGAVLQPVFRAAPYRAEAARQRAGGTTARLLFLDEGNHCRCAATPGCSTALLLFVHTSCAFTAGARLRASRRTSA